MKPNFIPEARYWYKLFTIQGIAVIGAIQGTLVVAPASWLAMHVPFLSMTWADLGSACTIAAAVITAFGRLIKQNLPEVFKDTLPTGGNDIK